MDDKSNFSCRIYVDNDEIYSGDFSEVPEKFRSRITADIAEWAGSLGKRGVNELLYSHLTWYESRGMFCNSCEEYRDSDKALCTVCSGDLEEKYIYERNEKIDKILTCVGMITKIDVSQ